MLVNHNSIFHLHHTFDLCLAELIHLSDDFFDIMTGYFVYFDSDWVVINGAAKSCFAETAFSQFLDYGEFAY